MKSELLCAHISVVVQAFKTITSASKLRKIRPACFHLSRTMAPRNCGTKRSVYPGFAFVQGDEFAFRNAAYGERVSEIRLRPIDRFCRQLKRPEMHADAVPADQVPVSPHRFGRIHVHRPHEPARLIGADAEHRDVGRAEAAPDVGEMRRISAVAAEIDAESAAFDHIPAPQALL